MTESEASVAATYHTPELTLADLASVGVKLLGLYAIISAVPQLAWPVMSLFNPNAGLKYMLLGSIPMASQLAIGVALLWGANWVVSRLVRTPQAVVPPLSADAHFQAMAFSVLGVLFVIWGIAGLARQIAYAAALEGSRAEGGIVVEMQFHHFVEPALELVAGAILFLSGRGLALLWHGMRHGGVRQRELD